MSDELTQEQIKAEAKANNAMRGYAIVFWFLVSAFGSLFASFAFIVPDPGANRPLAFWVAGAIAIPTFILGCLATRNPTARIWSCYGFAAIAIVVFAFARFG